MSIILRQKLDETFDHIIRRAANTDLNSNVDNCTADEVQVSVKKGDKMTALSIPKSELTIFGQQLRSHSDKDTFICEVQIIPDEDVTIDEFALEDGSVINVVERCVGVKVKVECLDGSTILLDVRKNGTIMEIEKKIGERVIFDRDVHVLEYRGVILEYDDKMEDRDISEGSVIRVVKMARETMRIFVGTLDGLRVDIYVTKSGTIIDIKKKIQEKMGLSPDRQILQYQGLILDDDRKTVNECGIMDYDTITVEAILRDTMGIFVRTVDEMSFDIKVTKSDTIIDVKRKIQFRIGLSPDKHKLVYQGGILEDDKTVDDYQIEENSVINVVARLRGGMIIFAKTMDGKTVVFEVTKIDRIIYIKKKIQENIGLSPNDQILQYRGLILNDDRKTVDECGIVENCTIIVVERLRDTMMIFGKTMDGKTVAFKVSKNDRIIYIKKKIQEKIGLSPNEQKLVYQGGILEDNKTVNDYKIVEKSVINVVAILRGGMIIFAKTMDGKTVTFEVSKSDRIIDIKRKIQEKIGLSPDGQKLLYQGGILEDNKIVNDYQIAEKSVINVVARLRGGMEIFAKTKDGKTVAFEVSKNDRIIDIKWKIREKIGLSPDEQTLLYNGQILKYDNMTVNDYQIVEKSVINVEARLRGGMQIFAKTMNGKTVAFEVSKSDRIIDIKRKIQEKMGLSPDDLKLVYHGGILEDEDDMKTVEGCHIDDCSVVNVVTKSRDMLHINIKMVDCRLVPLTVTSIDTVLDIKWMIQGIEGHLKEVQLLKVDGRILHDDSVTVPDCGIRTGGTITVSIKKSLTIYILTFDMETVPMKVYTSDRVIDMKKAVKVKTGLSVEDQIFVHRRKIVCVDRDTMDRYRVSGQCDMIVTATLKNMDEKVQATLK